MRDSHSLEVFVDGMTCVSCARSVETLAREVGGVRGARVNLGERRLTVTFDRELDVEALERSISDAGFVVRPMESGLPGSHSLAVRMVVACFFAMNAMLPAAVVSFGMVPRDSAEALVLAKASAAIALPAVAVGLDVFLRKSVSLGRRGFFGLDFLVTVGLVATVGVSVRALAMRSTSTYFDTAAMIVAFALLGRYLEALARGKIQPVRLAVAELLPQRVTRLLPHGQEMSIPLDAVVAGDLLRFFAGQRIGADGTIEAGFATVDSSALTGEAIPLEKGMGDEVVAGERVVTGSLDIRAERVGAESWLSSLASSAERLMAQAPPVARLADRASRWLVWVSLVLGGLAVALGRLRGLSWDDSALRGVAVLVVTCPCALAIAVPTVLSVAASRAVHEGIAFQSFGAVEQLAMVDRLVLDKTGTLTSGTPSLAKVDVAEGTSRSELLGYAAAALRGVPHPLASAVCGATLDDGVTPASGAQNFPGLGVLLATAHGDIRVGRPTWLRAAGIEVPDDHGTLPSAMVAVGGRYVGRFEVDDVVLATTRTGLAMARSAGLSVSVCTGDGYPSAARFAREVGFFGPVVAGASPEAKLDYVVAQRREGIVAFVGDGVNDAAALSAANVGIVLGRPTRLARSLSAVRVTRDDLVGVVRAVAFARAVRWHLRVSVAWAVGYNVVLLPLAVLGALTPAIAAASMALSSISVIGYASTLGASTRRP